ncbi:hypothetical protein HanHA300_Chr11g0421141 [Helianthus annuus]|uniref:Uncharacterized protein n=1 Tax=Helianthus annuus TaxID=4232 RepID=A0A251TCZ2_HELAN|nr:hypothetical protein HanHA300_Chr11g0421141 [Helianthus annuus]KAJ0519121.1 hypothetical protein HanHA89_Chr11g0445271 [Helianthus annuus]KAJ0687114.1 hypothetical protein HanLR1_Chr11g0422501 [Helianthus annuus]
MIISQGNEQCQKTQNTLALFIGPYINNSIDGHVIPTCLFFETFLPRFTCTSKEY